MKPVRSPECKKRASKQRLVRQLWENSEVGTPSDEKGKHSMSQVQFGLLLPLSNADLPRQVFLDGLRAALDTAKGHFTSAWLADHLQFGNRPVFEGWTMLTYLADCCPDFYYGHLVLCQLFRNPALL